MSRDEEIVLGLFAKLLKVAYVDLAAPTGERRFLVDGCSYEATQEELDAFKRLVDAQEEPDTFERWEPS